MEEVSKNKRVVAAFVSYRKAGDSYEFFLQKRTLDAPTHPGQLGTFGGGVEEGEDFEGALYREVLEELAYTPMRCEYWSRFESDTRIFHYYTEEVDQDFEQHITVNEGEYGTFKKASDIIFSPEASETVRYMIAKLDTHLMQKTH